MSATDRIVRLATSFPGLRDAAALRPVLEPEKWDPQALDRWATDPGSGAADRFSARFVLAVWNSEIEWKAGRFDVVTAMATWDRHHRQAFLRWAAEPFSG